MSAVTKGSGHAISVHSSAQEARSDQLATAAIGLGSAVVGAAFALFGRGTTVAVFVGLLTLCVTPGCAFVCWNLTQERLTRVLAVLAASLTWTILGAAFLAWLHVTSLGVLLAVTAGMGGIGSAIFLLTQFAQHPRDSPDLIPLDARYNSSARTRTDAHPDQRFHAAPRLFQTPQVLLLIALAAAAALFAISVIRAHGHNVGSYGLLPLLGVSFIAASALTVAVLVIALRFIRTAWPTAVAAVCLLLVEFNGTPMMLDPTPMSSWTYKHFGIVDYLVHGGALNDPFDIFQQWPGFFAAAGELTRFSGRSPLAYANWAQLLFEALDALVLFAIARRLIPWHRAAPYIAVLFFVTANWEGQYYFSPQSTAFSLSLLFQYFLLPSLETGRLRRPFRNWHWLRIPPLAIPGEEGISRISSAARTVGLIALFAAIVVTHQMSPYIVLVGIGCLYILGVLRQPVIVMALVAVSLGYLLLHGPAVQHNFVLNGFSFSNASGANAVTHPSLQQAVAGFLAKAVGLGIWGAAFICVLSYRRRIGVVAIPAILAFAPFMLIMVSSYDGEGIYRVFLFTSPWCALIIARRLVDLRQWSVALRLTVIGCWTMFAALGSAQAQDFGMYPMVQVPQGEISADAYFLNHAPLNASLILAAANFPSRLNSRYVLHNVFQSQNDLSLDEIPAFEGNGLKDANPRSLARTVAGLAGGVGYLVVAPSMQQYDDYYGILAPGTLSSLRSKLKASAYWKVWYQNDGTIIFQAVPQGQPRRNKVHTSP